MSTISHKQKGKKNRLQKKVQQLQTERDELITKLLECESEIAEKIERFDSAEREYKGKIHSLELKLRIRRHEQAPILQSRLGNWIFFGVLCSILPLVMNILFIWILEYNITLSDIISDFLLVIFAVSINLISILFDQTTHSLFSRSALMLLVVFSMVSLNLSIVLSNFLALREPSRVGISMIFLFCLISLIIVAILGVIVIIRQNKK